MANIDIVKFRYENEIPDIKTIFFLTSARKLFSSETEKNEFFNNWTELYFAKFPDLIFLARPTESPKVLAGYLTGCPDSESALGYFADRVKSYELFKDQFKEYPAHLHINCMPDYQGLGVGRQLLEAFFNELRERNVTGVHIITSALSRNVDFYRRNGFDFSIEREFNGSRLRFMGKKL